MHKKVCKTAFLVFFVVSAMLLCFVPTGVEYAFGDIEFASIMFHIFMPKRNMSYDWFYELVPFIVAAFVVAFLIVFCVFKQPKLKKFFIGLVVCVFLFGLYNTNKHFLVWKYIIEQYTASDFIKNHYIDPQKTHIIFPTEKQNLIFIQVESLEASVQDVASGGLLDKNYISELTKLAQENINFSPSRLVGGAIVLPETGWTMGALVAQTAGIPLKSYKTHKSTDQIGNRYREYKSFLSSVTSLGDILKQAGYENYFILGSFQSFGGQDIYLEEHGAYIIYDIQTIKEDLHVRKPDQNWWGVLDEDVYKFSKKKLTEVSKRDKPFSLIIQTIDSHRDGFLSPNCSAKYDKRIENVYACVSAQLNEFINWCMKQDFFKNTTIVVLGDHCNMSKSLFAENINKQTGLYEGTQRTVYNVFINSRIWPYQEKNRLFSTMDMFPTILAAIGATIEGDRLGLGTNLFSSKKTLLEEYGYDYLYQEMRKKSNFYNSELLYPK